MGDPTAQCILGLFYSKADDYHSSQEWLLKSANQDFEPAEDLLLKLYSKESVWDSNP